MFREFTGQPFGIIVGSTALSRNGFDFREPKDIDMFLPEGCPAPKGVDCQWFPDYIISMIPHLRGYATTDAVYTIKCSHLPWDIRWSKHYRDMMYMKSKGCKIIPDLYRALSDHWQVKNGNKDFLSLNRSKDVFFNDHVEYVYDHDYLHELVAYPDQPMYAKCLKEGKEVLIDKDKFFHMPFEDRVWMFKEEIAVIACERWLIPPKVSGKIRFSEAWGMSLRKTVTALTKGWASEFIVLNMEHFYKPDRELVSHLFKTLNIGDINMGKKADLTVFNEIAGKFGMEVDRFVYAMCENCVEDYVEDCVEGLEPRPEGAWGDIHVSEWYKIKYQAIDKILMECGYEHIDQDGGGEGGSEDCYGVFKLGGKIYKAEYSYYSYSGHEYYGISDTLVEVEPKTKTITVFE